MAGRWYFGAGGEVKEGVEGRRVGIERKMPVAKRRERFNDDRVSLTAFRRNAAEYLRWLRRTKRPLVLTVRARVVAVILDVAEYRRLRNVAESVSGTEEDRQGRSVS